jgi:hypothetical protein
MIDRAVTRLARPAQDALIVQRKLYDSLCEGYVLGLGRGLSLLHELLRRLMKSR